MTNTLPRPVFCAPCDLARIPCTGAHHVAVLLRKLALRLPILKERNPYI